MVQAYLVKNISLYVPSSFTKSLDIGQINILNQNLVKAQLKTPYELDFVLLITKRTDYAKF